MKYMGILLVSFFTLTAHAALPFTDGDYSGDGYWKNPQGKSGKYKAEMSIKGMEFSIKLKFDSGEEIEEAGAMVVDNNGFYKVTDKRSGKEVGEGYCGSVWCHTSGKQHGGDFEETMAFIDDNVYVLGSAKMGNDHFMWEHALKKN